ncbi:dynein light chain [Anaeramoeba ignava]|uniref:Dynein light chain n=1 Tax=Anaeramoeba ignava TaxID=1746090 RepID=A0A9Q0LWW9_ANAIG|nr:dynein light chain [Anaeramoeba ignava]
MTESKVVVKNVDMVEEMQNEIINEALTAFEKFTVEKDIAGYLKRAADKKYGPTFHVIVGKSFGSFVTHESKNFIYFYVGQTAVLLFKCG